MQPPSLASQETIPDYDPTLPLFSVEEWDYLLCVDDITLAEFVCRRHEEGNVGIASERQLPSTRTQLDIDMKGTEKGSLNGIPMSNHASEPWPFAPPATEDPHYFPSHTRNCSTHSNTNFYTHLPNRSMPIGWPRRYPQRQCQTFSPTMAQGTSFYTSPTHSPFTLDASPFDISMGSEEGSPSIFNASPTYGHRSTSILSTAPYSSYISFGRHLPTVDTRYQGCVFGFIASFCAFPDWLHLYIG